MGAPKQKWTSEEEAALRAGVEKYGAGKWRAIQKDPKFGPVLKSRSNVDLKDKWRNLSACAQGQGHSRSSKVLGVSPGAGTGAGIRKPLDVGMDPLSIDASSPFPDAIYPGIRETPKASSEKSPLGSRYDDYILEAILGMKHPAGSSTAAIANYVEERHIVPPNFRKFLNSKLKSLTLQGKLTKVDQNYKVNTGSTSKMRHQRQESDDEKRDPKKLRTDLRPRKPKMDVEHAQSIIRNAEEAAVVAAKAVAEAEAAAVAAEQAAREADIAEAEAEAAEAAAEAAALAARPPRKSMRPVPTVGGAFALTV